MYFQLATVNDTTAVQKLWAYCFEPADHPFFNYYFTHAYEPENTLLAYDQSLLAAMVHLRPFTISVRNTPLTMSYMIGVATDPVSRRGGIGGTLLQEALKELHKRGHGFTILMPSKASFYQQYGWDLYCHQWVHTLSLDDLRPLANKEFSFGRISSSKEYTRLVKAYDTYTNKLSGFAVRSEREWIHLIESVLAEGAHIGYVKDNEGTIHGYCIYRLGEPEIFVSEFVYTSPSAKGSLLNYIYNHRSQGTHVRWNEGLQDTTYIFEPDGKHTHSTMPFMMSRIVDVKTAIESIPVPAALEGALQLSVSDSLCPWNHGTYIVTYKGGTASVVRQKETTDTNAELTFTIGGLSLLLMGRLTATELAFHNKLKGAQNLLDILNKAYPKQQCYINEWW